MDIDTALQIFSRQEGEQGWKEHVDEINQKILDTSETSDKSVLRDVENAKKQIEEAQTWTKDYLSKISEVTSKEFDSLLTDEPLNFTIETLKDSLIGTINLHAKTNEMEEAFTLYKQNIHWISQSSRLLD